MKRNAFITGITGQDGSYLAELLLANDYIVHGLVRRTSTTSTARIAHLLSQDALLNRRLFVHTGDMTDSDSLVSAIRKSAPDEIYNLAAMSQVRQSYDAPISTGDIVGLGFVRLLEAVQVHAPKAKVYQASSSEMFGEVLETPQTETTPFNPQSPYGCAKAYAFNYGRAARKRGLRVYNGILFNHESPRRGSEFLSKKVVAAAVRIKQGQQDKLYLGNLSALRDWGSAKDYVYWIWKIMQQPEPDDFLLATGEMHTVEEFVALTFDLLGLDWRQYVVTDPTLFRPAEVDLLLGDATKARDVLGFRPSLTFSQLVSWMVRDELHEALKGVPLSGCRCQCSNTKMTAAH